MKLIRYAAQAEPAATCMVVSWAAGAICALLGHGEFAGALAAAGLGFLGVRTQVTPAKKAAETTAQAATTAALEVAKNLTDGTAGKVGEVTGAAGKVIDEALGLVSGLTGGAKT